jgi:RNA polymerase sigma-70 factor (ECF subfamily)
MFEIRLFPVVRGSNLNALAELSLAFANRGDKIRKRTGSILPNRGRPGRRMSGTTGEVTILLGQLSSGDSDAANRLIPLVFHELRQLARHYLKTERTGHTLQPTALVNEAYLRLVGDQARDWRDRAHFIGVSASIMRRILIDYARRRHAFKRGGCEWPADAHQDPGDLSHEQAEELIALNDALDRLEQMNARQRQVVELRYFGGLSLEETAEALGISSVTVKRDWTAARAWLKGQVRPEAIR